MQHDTSPHDVYIGGTLRRVNTAALVLAYSRRLFFQFSPRFTRFDCKVFLDEAVAYHDGACERCMIDNTHVIVLHGTGRDMVPVPEMEAFGRRLGFSFIAHAVGDPDRKARVEGPFWFIEKNFLAGRKFTDFADANRQARQWCDKVNATFRRSLSASSNELYAVERPKMRRLPAWRPEIYQLHQRVVDLEGYIHVDGHIYSVPYPLIGKPVEVRESKDQIRVFRGPRQVAVHAHIKKKTTFETFFAKASKINPLRQLIKGVVCGVRVKDIKDPLMREIRYLDKLIDELAKGKEMAKILRKAAD
jgi:hypothetical protein